MLQILSIDLLFYFNLANLPHHVLDYTHSIFIQGKSKEIFCDEVEIVQGILNGKGFKKFLDKVGCIVVSTKLVKIIHYYERDR